MHFANQRVAYLVDFEARNYHDRWIALRVSLPAPMVGCLRAEAQGERVYDLDNHNKV